MRLRTAPIVVGVLMLAGALSATSRAPRSSAIFRSTRAGDGDALLSVDQQQ